MKNHKTMHKLQFNGVEITYVKDEKTKQTRVYDPHTNNVWFCLTRVWAPGAVRREIDKQLRLRPDHWLSVHIEGLQPGLPF